MLQRDKQKMDWKNGHFAFYRQDTIGHIEHGNKDGRERGQWRAGKAGF